MIRALVELMTGMSARVEGHAEVSGPKRFVHTREVEIHLVKMLHRVVIGLEFRVTHFAQPKVHSLRSILMVAT